MSCISVALKGLANDCESSLGGVKRVYIANYPTSGVPYTIDEATGTVTGITSGITWYPYYIKKNTSQFTSTLNVDFANGINYVSTELVLQFTKMETKKRIEMAALALNDVAIVVEDSNGVMHALGASEAVNVTAGTAQTGQSKGDGNFYQLTFTDEYPSFLPILTEDAFKAMEIAEVA